MEILFEVRLYLFDPEHGYWKSRTETYYLPRPRWERDVRLHRKPWWEEIVYGESSGESRPKWPRFTARALRQLKRLG